jgi:eukaryotic-like serine/threonine-protein kinase
MTGGPDRDESDPRPRRFGALPRFLLGGMVVALLAFGFGFIVSSMLWFRGAASEVIALPDLRGQTEESARATLRRIGVGLELGPALENPEVEAGRILAQSPLPGEEVSPGAEVRVVMSAGPETRVVPDVRTLRGTQAREQLTRHGFEAVVEERTDDAPAGRILDIIPSPGSRVALPATVRLVVSTGPPMETVPDVFGMDEGSARRMLEQAGFTVGDVDRDFFSVAPSGVVTDQSPGGGRDAPRGSRVGLVVSAGGNP